ncbi:MCE family protein [Mycolicibacterium sp.]|uniref:MCE family protein n=1 Tax=Mycolicibacterium sp. TaxID=2320850 RepID=UPI0037C9253F
MFSRLIRIQLVIFTIASIVGAAVMAFNYLQVPLLLGIGRINVTLELPAGGGLYRFANVTYRGVQIGKVTEVLVTPVGAKAELSLDSSPRIPADLVAEVHSVSAVGEQYVDLLPRTNSAPYLRDGSVIGLRDSTIPAPVGPILDKTSALLGSIPKDKLSALLDETSKGFDDAGYDIGSLLDSGSTVTSSTRDVSGQLKALIDDSAPLLDGAARSHDATRVWMHSLAGVTDQLVTNDPQIRTLLQNGPGALDEATALLDQLKPTLPVLLANLTSLGKVAVTYNPSLEQLLVLVPPFFAGLGALSHIANATGLPLGDFRVGLGDPPACTVGFLPPSQWRSPADTTTIDTPDGLYCKLPQDSPIMVRGLRNLPCMAHPGKRAPTVQLCDSDQSYEPLALRQHALGPSPLDPNLVAQGIPPDTRVDPSAGLYGPLDGTPLPQGPPPPPQEPPPPSEVAPSSYNGNTTPAPSVVVTGYDPRTGRYLGTDGQTRTQSELLPDTGPADWQHLVLPAGQ